MADLMIQEAYRPDTQICRISVTGGQRRIGDRGERDIIDSYNRDILRHFHAGFLKSLDGAQSNTVIDRQHGGRECDTLAQQGFCAFIGTGEGGRHFMDQ